MDQLKTYAGLTGSTLDLLDLCRIMGHIEAADLIGRPNPKGTPYTEDAAKGRLRSMARDYGLLRKVVVQPCMPNPLAINKWGSTEEISYYVLSEHGMMRLNQAYAAMDAHVGDDDEEMPDAA